MELYVLIKTQSLGTALLAFIFLGERLARIQVLGIIIVIIGVTLVQWRRQ